MNKSDSIAALAAALAKAQAEIENAAKNAANPHFRSKYADLAEVLNTVRPVFAKHGIAVIQAPSYEGGIASVETMLTHASGEWLSNTCAAPVSKQDAQGVGSAITYLRRYSLAAFAGVAQEDDDGNASVGQQPRKPAAAPAPATVAPPAITDDRFSKAMTAIRDGKSTAASVRAHFTLTTEQDNELHALEQELKQ
jgi:hypothetical protein